MRKSVMLFGLVFGVGLLLGMVLAVVGRLAPSTDRTQTGPATTVRPGTRVLPSKEVPPAAMTSTEQAATMRRLSTQLDNESAARQRLEKALDNLQDALQTLEQRFEALTAANHPQPADADGRQPNQVAAFIEAGFDQDEATLLIKRWGQQQMDLLYLQDQATREGWITTPRYGQAIQNLVNGEASIRAEIGPESYDKFLYAMGQSNRVVVNAVIDSSPAQDIGLQPGDAILTYDGKRIFFINDLHGATTGGEPDTPVTMEVDRGGQVIEFEIDRGPIGVILGARRVNPTTAPVNNTD